MAADLTVGDDFLAPCPHCDKKMNIGRITASNQLEPGHVDQCNHCGKSFVIDRIDYIPNVWIRPHQDYSK
jgi:hypothetical protein